MAKEEKPSEYLIRKGWVRTKTGHAWQWSLPPTPGLFRIQDAVDTQKALDKAKKAK